MEPRSKPPRPSRPYAIGEDAGSSAATRTPATAGGRRARQTRASEKAPAPRVYAAGADTRARGAATHERWRPVVTQRTARRWRISPKRAFSVGVPLAALLALIIWLLTGSYWQTRHVRIEGTSDATLLALAHAQQLTGCNAFRCDFSAARRAIAASPRAQQVVIQVVFPDTTLVRITPRQTAALWRAQGQTWAVGADGVVIGAAQRDPSLALPSAATVDDPGDLAFSGQTPQPGAHMDATLVAMARQLRISGPGVGLDPASLRYASGDGFTMLANTGAQVIFGSPADAQATLVDLKGEPSAASASTQQEPQLTPGQTAQGAQLQVEVAGAILAKLARSGASATLIDVRWGSHPYYR